MEFAEGAPCWADAALPDVESGKRFYGDLFGWTFDEGAGAEYGYYTQAYRDGRNVAALTPDRDGRTPTGWTVYFKARDAETASSAVRGCGGHLLVEPLSIGPFGTMALAADPEGTVFGLWQAGTHTGFETQGEPGTFRRTELHARDRTTVAPSTLRSCGRAPLTSASPPPVTPRPASSSTSPSPTARPRPTPPPASAAA